MNLDATQIILGFLQLCGVALTAWVAYKMRVIVHQTNSMQEEMQRLAKAEGKAEGKAEEREKSQ